MASFFGNKYEEYDMNKKIINGGEATLKGLASAGNSLYQVAKPVVKNVTKKAVQGVEYLCEQILCHLSDNKKDKKPEDPQEKDPKESVDYPSFEIINKENINNMINQDDKNEFTQKQNNNIQINEIFPFNNNNIKPDYTISPELESSINDSSIVGEK